MKDTDLTAVFALTVDQRDSRREADRVPQALAALTQALPTALLPPERTAGDEVQLLLGTPDELLAALEALTRQGGWWIGIGAGRVEAPLPPSTREARGEAYLAAREAVEQAAHSPLGSALRLATTERATSGAGGGESVGGDAYRGAMDTPHDEASTLARDAEAALWLWQELLARRSAEGWQVVDLLDAGHGVASAAQQLGISASAVSQRHQRAGREQARRGRELCEHLLARLQHQLLVEARP